MWQLRRDRVFTILGRCGQGGGSPCDVMRGWEEILYKESWRLGGDGKKKRVKDELQKSETASHYELKNVKVCFRVPSRLSLPSSLIIPRWSLLLYLSFSVHYQLCTLPTSRMCRLHGAMSNMSQLCQVHSRAFSHWWDQMELLLHPYHQMGLLLGRLV